MNRIFRIVWNKAISQLVVTSELSHRSSGGSVSKRVTRDARATVLPLAALAAALSFATPAFASGNLAMPGGAILDINNGTGPNSATNTANQFQNYSVTFTAAESGNNYILFAFRQDPRYWTFGNVSMFAGSDTSTNLFANPLFTQGGAIGGSNVQAPADWGVVYQTGTVPRAAGTWHAPGSSGVSTTNVNTATAGSWYDGAVGSFDGIYQGVDLVAGITYTINFTALSNDAANTAGSGTQDVEMGVFAGTCLTLTGPVANCVPDNPDFQVLATPEEAANAGGPTTVPIATPTTTTDLGTTDGAFDGGTLVVDQDNATQEQDFTISGNGGTIDQNGRDSTFTGTISDETDGTPGDLTVTNSGNGGSVTLTGENTYTGHTSIDDGATLALSGDGSISSSDGLTNNGTFDITDANGPETVASLDGNGTVHLGGNDLDISNANGAFTGSIDGNGGVNVSGGTQVLTGNNTYTGGTTVTDATVSIDNGNALGTGTVSLDEGTLNTSETMVLGNDVDVSGAGIIDTNTGTTLTHTGTIGGDGDFVKDGAGTLEQEGTLSQNGATVVNDGRLVLSGDNTYTGPTVLNDGGTLEISSDANLGTATGALIFNGGSLHTTGTVDSSRNLVLNDDASIDTDGGTFMIARGNITGSGGLVKDGMGVLQIDGVASHAGGTTVNDGVLVLTGNNTYTGGNTINGGALEVGSDANLGDTSNGIAFSGGTLHTTADMASGRDMTVDGAGTVETDAGTEFAHGGTVSGDGDFVKSGEGTLVQTGSLSQSGKTIVDDGVLVLDAANTYLGDTVVNAGATVQVSGDANLGGASSNLVLNDGTLHATGNVVTSRDVSVNGGGTFDIDDGRTVRIDGGISGTGGLTQNGGQLILTRDNNYTGGTSVTDGTLFVYSDGALGTGTLSLDDSTLHVASNMLSARDIDVTGKGTITTDSGIAYVHGGAVTGTGDFEAYGHGQVIQTGVLAQDGATISNGGYLILDSVGNTYAGGTQAINGGVVQVSRDANLGAAEGDITLADGGTLYTTATMHTSRDVTLVNGGQTANDAGETLTLGGTISGNGGLTHQGLGTLVLDGENTYTGGTTVGPNSVVQISDDRNLGEASGGITLNGGELLVTDDVDSARDIHTSAFGGLVAADAGATFATTGGVTGDGTFYKAGEGEVHIDGSMNQAGGVHVMGGTLVLNGNNGYLGQTVIDEGGTLQVSSDANLGAGGDLVFDGGMLHTTGTFNSDRNLVLDGDAYVDVDAGTTMATGGTASGSGALVKDGEGRLVIGGVASHSGGTIVNDGILVLTANNTYTGGNTINGGTLQVQTDANLGDASNGIDFEGGSLHTTGSFTTARDLSLNGSGTIATDVGTTVVATGNVGGAAGLVKEGKGTLDISGALSQGGGTTVNAGTLILGGKNTYTGGTTINGGTLQVSSDENLGDASNDIEIDGGNLSVTKTMTTDRDILIGDHGAKITTADGVTLNEKGDMSGDGGLIKLGGGTLVVYGNNTFTGGTLIQGGVIRINSGSSLGTGQILLQGGTLQSDASLGTGQEVVISGDSGVNVAEGTTTVLSGNLVAAEGNGCFVKSGKGYLSLTGKSSLASGTCVQDGVLSANGTLASSFVQVDSIATLRGTGFIAGPVNVEGRLAAGNSPGTLTVAGTVTMQAGSTMQVDIDGLGTGNGAGNYSRVLVVGEGNRFVANGTLAPTLRNITGDASNTYTPALGDTYRIVTADGGVEGRFTTLEQPTEGLAENTRFLAFYGANAGHSIDLRVAPVSYAELLGANAKRNGLAAAGALDGAVAALDAGNDTATQNELLYAVSSLRAGGVASMVSSLSGEVHADAAAAARNAGLGMQRDVSDHLGTDKSADVAHNVWANVTRDGNRSIADGQGSGFETGTDRTTAGVDLYSADGTVIGVAGTHHDTNVIAHGGSGSIRGNSGIVYAQQAMGSFVLDGMAAYGTTDWTTRRADPMGGSQLETHTSGKDSMASATLRMPMQTAGGSRIEPYASVVWQKVQRDAVSERGSVAALSVDELSEKGTRVLAGVTMGSKAADPLASTLTWRAGIAVGADTGDLLDPTVHNTLAGQRFDTAAPGVGRGFVQVNANGTMRLGKSTYLYGGLTAEEGSSRSAYGVTAGVRVAF